MHALHSPTTRATFCLVACEVLTGSTNRIRSRYVTRPQFSIAPSNNNYWSHPHITMTTHQQQSQQLLSNQSWVKGKLSGSISYRMEVFSGPPLVQTCRKGHIKGHTQYQSSPLSSLPGRNKFLFTKLDCIIWHRLSFVSYLHNFNYNFIKLLLTMFTLSLQQVVSTHLSSKKQQFFSFKCKLSSYHAQLSYNCGIKFRILPINHRVV